jgi:hypothetical protein
MSPDQNRENLFNALAEIFAKQRGQARLPDLRCRD